jgi:ABC-type sulfate transport system permease subunit
VEQQRDDRAADGSTLTAIGITLIGVIVSVAATVGFGVSAAWWVRVLAGAGTALALVTLVKVGTRQGASGPMAGLARWITSWPG